MNTGSVYELKALLKFLHDRYVVRYRQVVLEIDVVAVMQIQRDTGLWYSAEYSTFCVSDEAGKYLLTAAGYSGDAGDALTATPQSQHIPNGKMFTTFDSDNDLCATGCNCAVDQGGGWWFDWCTAAGLNYDTNSVWVISSVVFDVQAARMLVKAD